MFCTLVILAMTGCAAGVRDLSSIDGTSTNLKTFQVSAYGAKGDGVSDDAPAIERTLKAAAAAGGGQVTFPCGEFSLLSQAGDAPGTRSLLYIKSATAISVVGQGSCSHLFTRMPQKSVLEFDDSSNISVTSLKITALNAPYIETFGWDGGSAIRFNQVISGNISYVEVDGASAGAFYLTKGTSSVSVTNNSVHDTYGSAIWEDDCGGSSATSCSPSVPPKDNVYQANTFTNTSLAAGGSISIDDGNGVSNALIENNTVSWNRLPLPGNAGVHCIGVNNASNVSVLSNSCTGTPWDAIVITTGVTGKSAGVTIQGNTILNSGTASNGGSGIVVYDAPLGKGVSGFTIASNTITTAATDGIRLHAASKPGNVQNGQITNNVIRMVDQRSPGSRFGIDVEDSASISINSNSVTGNGKCIAVGVRFDASSGTAPTSASNQVANILGPPLLVQ